MTVTNLQKAEAERTAISTTLGVLEQAVANNATTPLDQAEATAYLEMSATAKKGLFENLNKILQCLPADTVPYQAEFSVLLRQAVTIHSGLHGIVMAFPQPPPSSSAAAAAAVVPVQQQIKLPSLQIPQFHGDLQQWVSFRDVFLATVHTKSIISKIEKLSYLKSLVHGEAARQIQDIILSEANYDIAWSALTDRYNNERELLFSITSKLFNQQVLSVKSAVALRALMDTTRSCMRSLDTLRVSTVECSSLILYLVFSKLDNSTKECWLQSLTSKDIPDLNEMFSFLEQRATALVPGTSSSSKQRQFSHQQQKVQAHHVQATFGCSSPHRLYHCDKFRNMSTEQRVDHIMKKRLCFNCFGDSHSVSQCRSNSSCKTCGKKHNSLIHQERRQAEGAKSTSRPAVMSSREDKQVSSSHHASGSGDIPKSILATALVKVDTLYGPVYAHALLDNCSSNCIISEKFVRKWKVPITTSSVEVVGLSATRIGESTGVASFVIHPYFGGEDLSITALVMPSVSGKQPQNKLQPSKWSHLTNLQLADPHYHVPNEVDILIGGDIFWSLLHFGSADKRRGGADEPFAVNSTLGWLVVGKFNNSEYSHATTMITNIQLNKELEKFWNYEEVQEEAKDQFTVEEEKCETTFRENVIRLANGRFVVPIPWNDKKKNIGESKKSAVCRLRQMEKRLCNSEAHKKEYISFMCEYEELGHMTKVPKSELFSNQVYYIPHHFVLKLESTTTKFRVVFDGSAKSSTGVSVNDAMMIGPVVQPSLFDIILRFRLYPIAFTSDIAKMYRQVLIPEADRDMHRILWRESFLDDIIEYRLNTVTYGTASAPYLATRSLVQLAEERNAQYPIASRLIKNSCYVDDLMSGQSSISEAKQAVSELIRLGKSAQFPFRKWSCNNEEVLQSIPEELRETKTLVPMEDEVMIKTLGIYWNPVSDAYQFKINLPESDNSTKRSVLSEMSKLFDPLGWLAPVTIKTKIIMQDIWKEKIEWDQKIPKKIEDEWRMYKQQLSSLENLSIPRHFPHTTCSSVHLIGYADSSLKAYAAVIYLCGFTTAGEMKMSLVTSKTRVASINSPSLPRLELNAAVLLAELITSVKPALEIKIDKVQAFSDSTIVLAWINSDPNRWKMYVKNRILKIQKLLPSASWSHVKGTENPADCASRGLMGGELVKHDLWWNGNPNVVLNSTMPCEFDISSVQHEERKEVLSCVQVASVQLPFLTMYSSWRKLTLFAAGIIRIQQYIKSKKTVMKKGHFTAEELVAAKTAVILCVQQVSFASEFKLLAEEEGKLTNNNKFLCLNPFVHSDGLLKVGGRLRHAKLPSHQKNPVLLPKNHHVIKLIINDIHLKHFLCGAQQTLAILNQHYWIVRGRDTVRYLLRKCVKCTRQNASLLNQQMGDLLEARVNPARAFMKVGVDFAGPFLVRNFGRSKITQKVYLSVFVCLVTRAIHIELVSSLSTDAFLAAFRRFISRRGRPSDVFSDCGTNFQGADRELRELFAFQQQNQDNIASDVAKEGIHWHFNPPGAPHMGGLWEAGVKSIKYHLRRVLSSHHLTFEEFETLINQIEGLLNSRPITAISTDPNDMQVLTPAHFLIGEPITGIPDHDLTDIKTGRLDRWQLLQQKQQSFWRRWSTEFITRMQQRPKWLQQRRSIQLNDVVIIKDENQPPGKWRMGRVIATHPGSDGLIRVVTLKTLNGEVKRPIAKLCILFDQGE